MQTNSLCNKTIIFINGNDTTGKLRQSHITHTCYPYDVLNDTGPSQSSAAGCSQREHFSVQLLEEAASNKVITFYIYSLQFHLFIFLHSYWSVRKDTGIIGAQVILLVKKHVVECL